MIGYILAGVVALALLAVCVAGFSRARPTPGHGGRERRPLQNDSPAADEPTPDRSATAGPEEVRAARQHTPPA